MRADEGRSGALALYAGGADLVVLGLGHPELLEGAEGGEDRSANPDGEATLLRLRGGDHLDLHR